MSPVVAKKVNAVHMQLNCENAITEELSEFFTFFAPNYQFSPLFKKRHWDGKIRLFNKKTKYLYVGLLPYLRKFCEDRGYSVVVDEELELANSFSIEEAKEFADSLNIHSQGKKLEVRDYQLEAFARAIRDKRRLLLSPTSSGKSLIAYLIVRKLLEMGCVRGLVIVPTVSLVEQMVGDFKDYSSHNGWNADAYCQKIYQGKDRNITKPVVVSTWQSLYEMDRKYFSKFDFIIGDEAHLFAAKSLTDIMTKLPNAYYRIGTTGTLNGTLTHKLTLEGYFGAVYKTISTKELMDRKEVAELEIKSIVLRYPEETCKQVKLLDFQKELEFLVTNEPRNKFITNLALSLKGNTLVLFQYVDKHGKVLFEKLQDKLKETDRKVFFIHGGVEADERELMRAIVEKEDNAIIVASYGTMSTGVNIRRLHNVIFASPSKSRIRNLQSIGRGLRLGEGKSDAALYDIADDLRHKDYVNYTLRHYAERIKIYHEEKFKVNTYRVELKNG